MSTTPPPYGGSIPPSTPPTGAAWPPNPGYGQQSGFEEVNDSGQRAGVPPQIASYKWNWGAFALNWIWCFNHGLALYAVGVLALSLLGIIPIIGFIFSLGALGLEIYLGVNGHKLAWQNRRFDGGIPQYLAVETAWKNWGIALFVIGILLIPVYAAILFPIFARAREKAREYQPAPGAIVMMVQSRPQIAAPLFTV